MTFLIESLAGTSGATTASSFPGPPFRIGWRPRGEKSRSHVEGRYLDPQGVAAADSEVATRTHQEHGPKQGKEAACQGSPPTGDGLVRASPVVREAYSEREGKKYTERTYADRQAAASAAGDHGGG